MFDELGIVLRRIFQTNFHRKNDEKILFITDTITSEQKSKITARKKELILDRAKFGELLSIRTRDLYGTDQVSLISYPCTFQHGAEPPDYVINEMKKNQIFIALTSYSITYTEAIQKALPFGIRGASIPYATPQMFKENSPICADSEAIKKLGEYLITSIYTLKNMTPDQNCSVLIEDEYGTSFSFNLLDSNQLFFRNYGIFHNSGEYGNLPAGEIYTVPDFSKTAHGQIVVPYNNTKYCKEGEPFLELFFKNGKIHEIIGAKDILKEYLGFIEGDKSPSSHEILESRRNLALFGMGLNQMVNNQSSFLEKSKKLGTCHIGLGSSSGFGGKIKSDLHLGFILTKSNIIINNQPIITNGMYESKFNMV